MGMKFKYPILLFFVCVVGFADARLIRDDRQPKTAPRMQPQQSFLTEDLEASPFAPYESTRLGSGVPREVPWVDQSVVTPTGKGGGIFGGGMFGW